MLNPSTTEMAGNPSTTEMAGKRKLAVQALASDSCGNRCSDFLNQTVDDKALEALADTLMEATKTRHFQETRASAFGSEKPNKEEILKHVRTIREELLKAMNEDPRKNIPLAINESAREDAFLAIEQTFLPHWISEELELDQLCERQGLIPMPYEGAISSNPLEFQRFLTDLQNRLYYVNPSGKLVPAQVTLSGLRGILEKALLCWETPGKEGDERQIDSSDTTFETVMKEWEKVSEEKLAAQDDLARVIKGAVKTEKEMTDLVRQMTGRLKATAAELDDSSKSTIDDAIAATRIKTLLKQSRMQKELNEKCPPTMRLLGKLATVPNQSFVDDTICRVLSAKHEFLRFASANPGKNKFMIPQWKSSNPLSSAPQQPPKERCEKKRMPQAPQRKHAKGAKSASRPTAEADATPLGGESCDEPERYEDGDVVSDIFIADTELPRYARQVETSDFNQRKMMKTSKEEAERQLAAKVGFGDMYSAGVSGKSKHEESETSTHVESCEKDSLMSVHFQAEIVRVRNSLLDLIMELMGKSDYFIPSVPAGGIWNANGLQCQYVLDQVVVVQKLAVHCEDKSRIETLCHEAAAEKSAQSARASVKAEVGNFLSKASARQKAERERRRSELSQSKTSSQSEKEIVKPNLHVKFLLFRQLPPCPLRGSRKTEGKDAVPAGEKHIMRPNDFVQHYFMNVDSEEVEGM